MSTWLDNIVQLINNPYAIQRESLAQLEARVGGERGVVDPTNPFVHLMETSCMNAAAAMVKAETGLRRIYPQMAVNDAEVYNHMADADYIGRFATPALGKFRLMLSRDEVFQRAVPTGVGSIRKLTIPRNTSFSVAESIFTMQYPIDIRIMAHGGLQVVYDTSEESPLEILSSNVVDWAPLNLDGKVYLSLDIPAYQFRITRTLAKINRMTTFRQSVALKEDFYHARVHYSDVNGNWIEMTTTHSDQVFDPFHPTALLRVEGRKLSVEIPTVYLTQGLVANELRIDVYTTQGAIEIPFLTEYVPNSFVLRWEDWSADNMSQFSSPLSVFTEMSVFAIENVSGGSSAITFAQLRDRVITSALGSPDLPITNAQITDRLQRRGYSMVTDVDRITNRQFLATRLLPTPADGTLVSGSGSTMQTLQSSMQELVEHTYCVTDNGERITLLPSALYDYNDGLISIVPETTINLLNSLPVDVRARRLNESQYLFSPFHYVLDIANDRFDLRPYYMDDPKIASKSFIGENDTAGIAVSVASYEVQRIEQGYMVVLVTKSGDGWKALPDTEVFCQLAFKPAGEIDLAYQNGSLGGVTEDGERIYTFFLGTEFDIDENHNLLLNTFQMYDNGARPHAVALNTAFQVFFACAEQGTQGLQPSAIDNLIGHELLPADVTGLTHEELNVSLGHALVGLWSSGRSVVGSEDYARYSADVPWLYERDVYDRDAFGAIKIERDPDTDALIYQILHRAGDPILDQHGAPTFKYRVGDIQVDPDGAPIAISSRKMVRQSDLYMLDGVYWWVTDESTSVYRDSLPKTVVNWLETDIAAVQEFLLEQTTLSFYSQCTLGAVKAIVGEEKPVYIDAAQSFKVEFSVSGPVFRDGALRTALERMTMRVIDATLQKSVVTLNEIIARITAEAGSDVIAVKVTGLGGEMAYPVITLVDDAARLSIKRKAIDKADGTITVRDDVEISFIQHSSI